MSKRYKIYKYRKKLFLFCKDCYYFKEKKQFQKEHGECYTVHFAVVCKNKQTNKQHYQWFDEINAYEQYFEQKAQVCGRKRVQRSQEMFQSKSVLFSSGSGIR